MRGQRGQTAAEVAGILAIVAAVVVAIGSSGIGSRVTGGVSAAVCQILGAGCAAAGDRGKLELATAEGDDDGPDAGPAVGNGPGPVPVLPFPGSASASCTESGDPAATARCQAGKGPADAGVRVVGEVTRGEDRLNPEGCMTTTIGVTGALEAYGGMEVDGQVAGGGVELYGGAGTTYEVTVTPDRADGMADGDVDAPNPMDPTTLAPGEGIQMSEAYYAGVGLDGQYRVLRASLGFEAGQELSTGVSRVDEGTVRIYAGDADYVQQALQLGVGTDAAQLYLGAGSRYSQGELTAVDVDISTPEGWAAYQAFATSGELPEPGAAGTANPTSSETLSLSSSTRIGAALGDVDASLLLGDSAGAVTTTTNADGTVTTSIDSREDDVGLQVIRTEDADGELVGAPTYALNVADVDPSVLDAYQMVNGLPRTERDTLRLEYTAAELDAIQLQAVDQIRAMFLENGPQSDVPSRAEVLDQLEGNPYAAVENADGVRIAPETLPALLASAESPEGVLSGLANAGMGNGSSAVDALTYFALDTDVARNDGEIADSFPLDDDTALPGTPVTPSCGR